MHCILPNYSKLKSESEIVYYMTPCELRQCFVLNKGEMDNSSSNGVTEMAELDIRGLRSFFCVVVIRHIKRGKIGSNVRVRMVLLSNSEVV